MSDPLKGVAELSVSIEIGGDSKVQSGPALKLFGGDHKAAEVFEEDLARKIAATLEECQIRVVGTSATELQIWIYGGRVGPGCPSAYMFLVEMSILDDGAADTGGVSFGIGLMGSAEGGQLAEKLTETALFAVGEAMFDCRKSAPARSPSGQHPGP